MPLFDHASNFHIYGGTFNDIQGSPATMKHMNEILEDDERRKVLAWVSPVDVAAKHFDVSNTRQPGTGEWLLNSRAFQAWERGVGQALWCPGMPGAGKTVLASLIIDHLRNVQCSEPIGTIGVAWMYYNYKEGATQTPNSVHLSLIRQLAGFSAELYAHLKSAYQKDPNLHSSAQRLIPDMRTLTREFDRVFIVVDALDECAADNRDSTIGTLAILQTFGANILVTSRDHVYDSILDSKLADLKKIDIYATTDDITTYVTACLENRTLSKIVPAHSSLREEIIKAVVESCDGMFLIAAFHIDAIRKKLNAGEIRKKLKALPKTFPGIYDDAMDRIESDTDCSEVALRVLSLLIYARRQLTLPELQHFLAVQPDHTDFDEEFITNQGLLISICAGLAVFDKETGVIRLVHLTAQEYLDTIRREKFPDGDLVMARSCLTYLSFDAFKDIPNIDTHRYALLSYIVHYWHVHVHDHQETLIPLLLVYLGNDILLRAYSYFKETYHREYFDWKTKNDYNYRHTGLHVAAATGLLYVARELIEHAIGAHSQDFTERTPLIYSCQRGDTRMVEFLTSDDVEVDEVCGKFGTALHAASHAGHEAVVRWLVLRDAAINAEGGEYGTALQAASCSGHEAVLCLLLDAGASINAEGGEYGTALQAASCFGHDAVVRLLLRRGADVNIMSGFYGSALQAASCCGHEAVVRLLLEHGAAVNAHCGRDGTALQSASLGGDEVIVRLLLEHGADVNAPGDHWGAALQAASNGGHTAIVRLLLERGAAVNAQSSYHGTALQVASRRGHEAVMRLLLESGADINAQGGVYGTALQAASMEDGHNVVAVIRLLLKNGADVNAQGGKYGTALQAAAFKGRDAVVRLLLENGADTNAEGGVYGTALHAASQGGNQAVVYLLLESGAAVNAQGGGYGTALNAALQNGHEAVAGLLLERGAVIDTSIESARPRKRLRLDVPSE